MRRFGHVAEVNSIRDTLGTALEREISNEIRQPTNHKRTHSPSAVVFFEMHVD